MKKISVSAKVLTLLLALFCAAAGARLTSSAQTDLPTYAATVAADPDDALASGEAPTFELVGAQIRKTDPTGLRFVTRISKEMLQAFTDVYGAENVSFGTVLQREDALGAELICSDGFGNLASGAAVALPSNAVFADYDEYFYYTAVVVGIPQSDFGVDLVARPYLKYGDHYVYPTESRPSGGYSVKGAQALGGGYSVSLINIAKALASDSDVVSLYGLSAQDVLAAGIAAMQTSVDISAFSIPVSEAMTLLNKTYYAHPEFFYMHSGCSYSYSGNSVHSVFPSYLWSADQIPAKKAELAPVVDAIVAQVGDGWSDFEKCLFLHDCLAATRAYDETYSIHDTYTFFTEGTGVCQAYTRAYSLLLQQVGVESDGVLSDAMNHVWNKVKIDGNWYNVDVTWDDPVGAAPGAAYHNYFLLSDAEIAQANDGRNPHYGWDTLSVTDVCADTSFDTAFWKSNKAPFAYAGGAWYMIADGGLYTTDFTQQTKAADVDGIWFVDPASSSGYYWSGVFSGLIARDGVLIFNTSDDVRSYDPRTNTVTVIAYNPVTDKDIYGIVYQNDVLYLVLKTSPNETDYLLSPVA